MMLSKINRYIVGTPSPSPPLLKGGMTFQKLNHWGGTPNFLLQRGNNPERGASRRNEGLLTIFIALQFNYIYSVCVCGGRGGGGRAGGVVKFPKVSVLQFFELAIQDSHSSLYSTKTYHLYIPNPFC